MDHISQVQSDHTVTHRRVTAHQFRSTYDFGYLFKVLTCLEMPSKQEEFFDLLKYEPCRLVIVPVRCPLCPVFAELAA